MLRKLVLSAVAGLGLLAGTGTVNEANAGGLRVELGGSVRGGGIDIRLGGSTGGSFYDPHCRHYRVVYRECCHERWRVFGVYHSHRRAHEVADLLELRGYQARVLHD